MLLFAALMVYGLERPFMIMGDSGVYILLAQAIAAGEGYRDFWLVGSPPHTTYPPVFPLLMTGIQDLSELVYHNLYAYMLAAANIVLPALPQSPGIISAILVTAMIGIGLLIRCRTRRVGWKYYGLAYACVLLLYPAAYPRYLVPMIPLLWYYTLVSLRHGTRLLPLVRRLPMSLRWADGKPALWGLVAISSRLSMSILRGFRSSTRIAQPRSIGWSDRRAPLGAGSTAMCPYQ